MTTEPGSDARSEAGLRLWVEVLLVCGVYIAYSMVRNQFGSIDRGPGIGPSRAELNAEHVIDIERALGLYIEADIQEFFIGSTAFIQFWNLFYGVCHFLVTFGVLAWLYRRFPHDYRFWRRAGLIATSSAVVGYATFPLMPPRLLGDCGNYGACRSGERYVDTVIEVGCLWSFESTGFETISNQWAAMPSLHIGWAVWCALILVPRLASRPAKVLAASYPFLTLFAIVVTANHYWIDALGGISVIVFGYYASKLYHQVSRYREVVPSLASLHGDTTSRGLVTNRTGFTEIVGPIDSGAGDLGTSVEPGAP